MKRGRSTVDEGEGKAKRSRPDEDSENVERNSESNPERLLLKRRGRKGPNLYKGVVTCPAGIEWVKEFEKTHQTAVVRKANQIELVEKKENRTG